MEQTKLSKLLELMAAEKWPEALKFAAKFPRLGAERDAILTAKDAILHPHFALSIKQNPEILIAAGVAALKSKYLRLNSAEN
jgi:hypothetical protein